MRSEHISRAIMTAESRFAVCKTISKAAREMHQRGGMMSDTINLVAVMADPTLAKADIVPGDDESTGNLLGETASDAGRVGE